VYLLIIPTALSAQETVFTVTPEKIYIPLYIDGRFVGDINSMPMDEFTTEVYIPELIDFLSDRISEDHLVYFLDYPEEWASIESLKEAPILVSFNMFDLIIEAFIPPENSLSKDISLLGSKDPLTYPIIEPSDFSMYLNIYSSVSLQMGEVDDQFEVASPVSFTLDPSINLFDWTIEAQISTTIETESDFTFRYGRIIRDWEKLPLRLMIGDLSYETAPNQSSPSYFGALISRDITKSFNQKVYSNYSHSLLVPSDNMLVNIFMNNRRIKAVELNAGLYTINDFYFNNGLNEISIEQSKNDEISIEEFFFSFDSSLTPPGITEYTFGFGFKDRDLTTYPEIFGTQTFGIDNHMSGEYFFQAGMNQQNIGLSAILATNAGNVKSNLAISRTADNLFGVYSSVNFRYLQPSSKTSRSFTMTGSYTSEHYTSYSNSETAADQSTGWKLFASYGQNLFDIVSLSTSGTLTFNRSGILTKPSFAVALRTKLSKALGISASFSGSWDEDYAFTPGLTVSASLSLSNSDFYINGDQSFYDESNSLAVSYTPSDFNGDVSLGLNMSNMTSEDILPSSISIGANFKQQNFLLDTDIQLDRSGENIGYSIDLGLDTAFSYTDGLLGISTPINDSFVLVALKQQIPGLVLGVNPNGDGYKGRTDEWGAAVLNGFSSFTEQSLTVEPIEIPVGFEMGSDRYTFKPTYHQAGTVKIGVESNVTVKGKMVFSDGSPFSLYSGDVKRKGTSSEEVTEPEFFFTYTDGTYEIYGMQSGDYTVTLYIEDGIQFNLTIPEGLTGEIKINDVVIPVEYKVF